MSAGRRLSIGLRGPGVKGLQLVLWKPGTVHVTGTSQLVSGRRVFQSLHAGPNQSFQFRAKLPGWYDVEVKETLPGAGPYTLRIAKTP